MNKTEQNAKAIKAWWSKNKKRIAAAIKKDEHPDRYTEELAIAGIQFIFRHLKATKQNFVRHSSIDVIELK